MSTIAPLRMKERTRAAPALPLQRVAIAAAVAIALLYGLLFAGVLTIEGARSDELGILGVAGAVFALLAGLLWRRPTRLVWGAAAALQVLLAWMYVAIAPDRDPSFEVWGLTIRAISAVLLLAVVGLLLGKGERSRPHDRPRPRS